MLPFTLPSTAGRDEPLIVLAVAAHPDDLEIGCAGTLLQLLQADREVQVHWLVASGTTERAAEARASATQLLGSSAAQLVIWDYPDGYLPAHWTELKRGLSDVVRAAAPDLVFCPAGHDAHQDHRVMNELVWQSARRTTILEYEIPKWEADLVPTNLYVPLTQATAAGKVDLLFSSFVSQLDKPWFQADLFWGLMRLRGVECASSFAEAFHCRKVVLAT